MQCVIMLRDPHYWTKILLAKFLSPAFLPEYMEGHTHIHRYCQLTQSNLSAVFANLPKVPFYCILHGNDKNITVI